MNEKDCLELDQELMRVNLENPDGYGFTYNRLTGMPGSNWPSLRGSVEECMLEGKFTPANFPLLYNYLSGNRVLVKGNRFVLRRRMDLSECSKEELVSMGKNHFALSAAQNQYVNVPMASFKLREVKEETIEYTFDIKLRMDGNFEKMLDLNDFMLGKKVTSFCEFNKLLWTLLNFWDKLKYRRSSNGIVAYKEITNWDDCIEMVGAHAEKECRGGLIDGFMYLSEFVMGWKHQDELNELKKLSATPYVVSNSAANLLSLQLGDFNLVTLQEEVRRTEVLLRGLKSVEDILKGFIDRLKKNNPNGIDLRVSLGNWRPMLGLLTVVKVSQDAATYVDDRREYISTVARLVLNGDLNPAELPVV